MNHQIDVSTVPTEITLAGLTAKAAVSRGDVVSLNQYLFVEGSLDRDEAEALFDLERAALTRHEAWTTFFIEAVTDHVVWSSRPTGRLDEAQAAWLIDRVDEARTPASFAILVNVLDEAQQVPAWFSGAVRARAVAGWPGLPRIGDDLSRAPLKAA